MSPTRGWARTGAGGWTAAAPSSGAQLMGKVIDIIDIIDILDIIDIIDIIDKVIDINVSDVMIKCSDLPWAALAA